jgi:hypothetical protein
VAAETVANPSFKLLPNCRFKLKPSMNPAYDPSSSGQGAWLGRTMSAREPDLQLVRRKQNEPCINGTAADTNAAR